MPATARPSLVVDLFGLQSRAAQPGSDSGFSTPTWTWPEEMGQKVGKTDRPLSWLLSGRFVAPAKGAPVEDTDCRHDDPDRQALAALGDNSLPEIDALSRALGDWLLAGGSRDDFCKQISTWREEGFSRLLCFDPVHLKAETDHAITLGPRFLRPEGEPFDQLRDEINVWLGDDDMHLEHIGQQYYLLARLSDDGLGPASARLQRAGAPLACLLNRNTAIFIDEQHSEPILRQWLTELQMWLFPRAYNDARAARGQPILNSFWPHGMSELSADLPTASSAEALIISDSPAVLARHDAIAWEPAATAMSEAVAAAIKAGRPLRLLLTELAWCRLEGDLEGFHQELERVDAWLVDLLAHEPRLSITLTDGQGGVWRAESRLAGVWRGLVAWWRR
ncbi:MAG TPA: hypothetical protein VFC95_02270 [Guyparkeria sp.]|nr:hypothetical protein [Guyparkeria sp.]